MVPQKEGPDSSCAFLLLVLLHLWSWQKRSEEQDLPFSVESDQMLFSILLVLSYHSIVAELVSHPFPDTISCVHHNCAKLGHFKALNGRKLLARSMGPLNTVSRHKDLLSLGGGDSPLLLFLLPSADIPGTCLPFTCTNIQYSINFSTSQFNLQNFRENSHAKSNVFSAILVIQRKVRGSNT